MIRPYLIRPYDVVWVGRAVLDEEAGVVGLAGGFPVQDDFGTIGEGD